MKLDNVIAKRRDKTIYRDGDLCLKVFDESCPKHGILNEALNQARVELTGLNIPKVREVITIDGKWTIVSDFIEGKTLMQSFSRRIRISSTSTSICSLTYR